MTIYYSDQITALNPTGGAAVDYPDPCDLNAKLRARRFTYTASAALAADSEIILVEIQPGWETLV